MNKEIEETVLKAVEYTNSETERNTKRVHWLLLVGEVFWFAAQMIQHTELVELRIMSIFSDFAEGAACGMIICGIIATSRYGKRLRDFKKRLLKRQ